MEVPLSCLQILLLVMFSEPHNKDELLYHGLYIIIIMPRDFAVLLVLQMQFQTGHSNYMQHLAG